ncbi:hypothetical protein TOPH_00377 [Tolypocladium ophioglossoides CBS 100239]|uniref:Uncharacterized protein n=1 Tax=Tolypocladium ophioglossoides (strain CBS 100239) TaxID=1163406 RepID=A0A0L0NMM7_TOLOC|nr:hypothetical protein TOPH_00377 [Tolypocladium ophioglossoides CBS 100239]
MAPRICWWVLRGLPPLRSSVASRRLLSSSGSGQTRFSYFSPAQREGDYAQLFAKLKDSELLSNPSGHNASVILATPNFIRQLEDSKFVGRFAKLLSGSADIDQFRVLCAVVDQVAPALGEPGALHGISILRGHLDDTLPELWLPSPPKARDDADSVSALTFDLGGPWITLPLTRTTFQNNKTSTLLSSRFDMRQASPRLVQRIEKHSQRIMISLNQPPRSTADLGLWAPLSPITRSRVVTESFGNIVRGIQVDGKTEPASTELEDAVNTMFKHRSAPETTQGPMGVWAMITPQTDLADLESAPDPTPILQGKPVSRDAIEVTAQYLEHSYKFGGRLFQILSGGGGWGPKKGLLSIDPQRTHFTLSEEEEMARFMQTMNNSGFAPTGSQIQFFIPAQAPPEDTSCSTSGIVFGVPFGTETAGGTGVPEKGYLVSGHFGALASQGVFVSGPTDPETGVTDESKLSVPNSRVYVGRGTGRPAAYWGF